MSQGWARFIRRRVMLFAVGVCTLLAIAFVVLWLRSYFRLYSFKRYSAANRQFLSIVLTRGGVQLARSDGWDASALGEGFETIAGVPGKRMADPHWLGNSRVPFAPWFPLGCR